MTHIKTTVEIPDELLSRCRQIAQRDGASLKALIEQGLHLALQERERKTSSTLRIRPFKGDGLTDTFSGAGWITIRDEIYRDRA